MRHFATESGKSKGQFYTPAEVSRIMAQIIGIRDAQTTNDTTVYDPTCGSGSLLLKVGEEARAPQVTLYGQEKDSSTAGLAPHEHDPARLSHAGNQTGQHAGQPAVQGRRCTQDLRLRRGQSAVLRQALEHRSRSANDPYERFQHYGTPPAKQGDYAYLLHIVRSLKSNGKGACILPHGVLFRGNAEADIRRNLIRKGYIKGIIGLPANLFYGTGIPACIIVIDKENAHSRKGIFMIDASKGYHQGRQQEPPARSGHPQDRGRIQPRIDSARNTPAWSASTEIEKNDYNLNLPRYIDSSEPEDKQDIAGHLQGGIPEADVSALQAYWDVCPD